MSDLRDRIPDFEAAARRLLAAQPHAVVIVASPATCHPARPLRARGLCASCYNSRWRSGTLGDAPLRQTRSRADFVADYVMLRAEGYTRRQIAERLGMTRAAVQAAYSRAVKAGALTPDKPTTPAAPADQVRFRDRSYRP